VSLVGIIGATTTLNAQQVTTKEVVAACAEAMGGRAAIDSVRTLRIRYILPDHGNPIRFEVKRPNLSRAGDDLVFDGERAAFLDRAPGPDGAPRPAELVESEEWKDFEIEIGKFFPAFFDYPSEYRGIEAIEGIETHKLEVRLPLGGRLTYFLDKATHLPLMVESRVTLHGKNFRSRKMLGDYREMAGMLYPHEFTYYSPHMRKMFTVVMEKVELNAPLDDSRFAVPVRLYQPSAQSEGASVLKGLYLGQDPPGMEPQKFMPGIVSTDDHPEVTCTFSPDGKEFYFGRIREDGRFKIMVTHLKGDGWSQPEPVSFSANSYDDLGPHITPDGSKMFFDSNRPLTGSVKNSRTALWFVERHGDGWGEPEYFGEGMFATVAQNGNVYFTDDLKLDENKGVVVRRLVNGNYSDAETLSDSVNRNRAAHPVIAPDESFIVFDAFYPDGQGGGQSPDYYVSFKLENGSWSEAKNLGNSINGEQNNNCAALSPGAEYLFYTYAGDIYWVSTDVIERLKPD
jgi:hypothetical protein